MKQVKVWYLGILPLTRRMYLKIVIWGWAAVIFLFMLVPILTPRPLPPFHWPWEASDPRLKSPLEIFYFHYFYTFVAVCFIAQVVDVAIMLKKYAVKTREAETMHLIKDGLDD